MAGELSALQVQVLDVAKRAQHLRDDGRRQTFAITQTGLGYTAYLQILNGLLDNPLALAREPILINRLRRIRDARNAQRGH